MRDILAVVVDPAVFSALIAAVLGAGALQAYTAFRKAGPENTDLAAKTMAFVNDELRKANAELAAQAKARESELLAQIGQLRDRVAYLEGADRERRGVDPIPPAS